MTDNVTPEAVAKALEGVTPGPWRQDGASVGLMPAYESYVAVCVSNWTRTRLEAEANARFIAWAREAVPALAADRDAQRARADAAEAERDRWKEAYRCVASDLNAVLPERDGLKSDCVAAEAKVAKLVEAAKAHEAWEAKLFLDGEWSGACACLTPELHEEMLEVQRLRSAALRGIGGAE